MSRAPATAARTRTASTPRAYPAATGSVPRWEEGDPVATTVYVLGVGEKKCLVVPGTSADAAGFTRDRKAIIVRRSFHHDKWQLRRFALSSLHDHCPPRQVVTQRVTPIGR